MRTSSRRRVLALLLAAAVVFSSCAAARERRDRQDFLLESFEKLVAEKKTAKFVMGIQSERELTDHEDEVGRPIVAPPLLVLQGEVDLTKRQAVIYGLDGSEPIAVFDGPVLFLKRHKRGVGSSDPRDWAIFDFSAAETREEEAVDIRGGLGFNWFNPAYFLQFAGGALIGSVEDEGFETIQGVRTSHLKANFDRDKALRTDPPTEEEHVKAVNLQLRAMGHRPPSFEGEMWLDSDGVLRRLQLRFERRVDRDNLIISQVAIELTEVGIPVDIDVPERSNAKRLENQVQQLVEFDVPEAASADEAAAPAAPPVPTPAPAEGS